MKWLKPGLFFVGICLLFTTSPAAAETAEPYIPPPNLSASPVMITGYSFAGGKLEYVQLYNDGKVPVDLTGWRVELYVTNQATPVATATLADWMAPSNYLLVADEVAVGNPDFILPAHGLTGLTPKELRIVPASNAGFAQHIVAVQNGMYQRNISSTTGNFLSTFSAATNLNLYSGGFYDFLIATNLQFSEVVANPRKCSPLDASLDCGDYVKLYNPTAAPIDLSLFRLRVGYAGQNSSSSNTFVLEGILESGHYAVIAHDVDGQPISITNGGGFVWLEDVYGIVRYDATVTEYADAGADSKQGWAWAYDSTDGLWKWTSQPTPYDTASAFVLPVEPVKASLKSAQPCREDQYRSEETNRCRNIASTAAVVTPCKEGQERNPETNRCRSVAGASTDLKPCDPGQERNAETNRCRKATGGDIPGAAFAVQEVPDSASTFVGWWALGGVGVLAAGYGVWEWRREIWSGIRKTASFFTSGK